MKKLLFSSLALLVLIGAGCTASTPSIPSTSSTPAASSSSLDADAARFQAANRALVELLTRAASRQIDTQEWRQRMGQATYKSIRDMKGAADEMEQIVSEVQAALGE